MATMAQIEEATKRYAAARGTLADICGAFNQDLAQAKSKYLGRLKKAVALAKEREAELTVMIEESGELFVRPKTVVFHGVKVGFQKAKGKLEFDDADQVLKLIRKHFPEQADVLINTREVPAKEALAQLSAAELKRLGITVVESGDQIVIKDTTSEVDKMVEALLKDEVAEAA
ncbi:MAG: host-nuclease inhibitor Gam family protein [Burkholderiales bacterium]|nr:host-nuclease inhibitor Gam family protein [Burkholderiales bacterium]